jgi:superfamily II DNA or RNA helicase
MPDRLAQASFNLEAALERGQWAIPFQGIEEREEQREVLRNFLDYLRDIEAVLVKDSAQPVTRSRIVAAARLGKTEVMILLLAAMGLRAVICVPSITLVEQTVKRFASKLPSVAVGAYYGEAKDIVSNGVTVATYQTLAAHAKTNTLPRSIRDVAMVFCDEGHETMTEVRQDAIGLTFDSQAVVVAFTATPDYNQNKVLAVFYPHLIFELLMAEASTRLLLAPARIGYRILDVDASEITIKEGDYDAKALGEVTSLKTVFQDVCDIRYHQSSVDVQGRTIEHRTLGTLFTCNGKEQAQKLHDYLALHRPDGFPCPAVLVDSTSSDRRHEIIRDFDAGRLDTIIIVRTLLRGWNAPRCKLLIDLSPSRSRVLSEQKFSRPLTKIGDQTGFVFVVYPYGLRPVPILPTDIISATFHGDDEREFLRKMEHKTVLPPADTEVDPVVKAPAKPKKGPRLGDVEVKKIAVHRSLMLTLKPPTFDRDNTEAIRAVAFTSQEFVRTMQNGRKPARVDFREWIFEHETFVGNGLALLRYCRLRPGSVNFSNWIAKHFPEFKILETDGEPETEAELAELTVSFEQHDDMDQFATDDQLDPEDRLTARELWRHVFLSDEHQLYRLSERQRLILQRRLEGDSWAEIGEAIGLTSTAANNACKVAIKTIRQQLALFGWSYPGALD